jgi:trehalose 6-phosphate synthase/phosphatase
MGLTGGGRLIIVSNRLPVSVEAHGNEFVVRPASGGLATGLKYCHAQSGSLWIGWPGPVSGGKRRRAALTRKLEAERIVPLYLGAQEMKGFYEEFSNGVLWPLFHYLLDRVPMDERNWDTYRAVNERFADVVAEHYRPGDRVWIHDYQLMLLPRLLRDRIPDARIGFFLHIPFPSSDIFRILPWRSEILEGLLGANLVGFHTYTYLRHFTASLLDVLGIEPGVDHVWHRDHMARVGAFPMGIDAAAFERLGDDADVQGRAESIRRDAGGRKILLGIDRLDYTKGIPRRLRAFERLLAKNPELDGTLRLIQVAVPSRTNVSEYKEYRKLVETQVGRINGSHTTIDAVPIHYIYRSVSETELAALYRAADVMLVTPLRDGMNLVSKEFVATRTDENGVLLLSEFAGAASELGEALRVNPYDVDGMADTMKAALNMPEAERQTRMRALRKRVRAADVHAWVDRFLEALDQGSFTGEGSHLPPSTSRELTDVIAELRSAPSLTLILDYDGTLVPLVDAPELATPDPEVLRLLQRLIARPNTRVHVASGRTKESLEKWLSGLDVHLWAEHGYWSRPSGCREWTPLFEVPRGWEERIRPILEQFTARTPGSLIEEKTAALTWHYRMADPDFGTLQARKLRAHLADFLHNRPVEVLLGSKVVEIRLQGVNKGRVVAAVREKNGGPILAIGDNPTDEDLFAALPEGSVAVHVGSSNSLAPYRVPDVAAVRKFLEGLLEG